jgi:biotin operon repressor
VSVKIPDGGQELVAIARILGMFNTDFNTLLAAIRRFGFVVKRLAHGGYELIPEDQVVSEGLDSLDDYDEPTDLPWDAAEA